MNYIEIEILEKKLKNYGFKFDEDILRNIVNNYESKDVMNIYQEIIENKDRLTGLNIIAELKERLRLLPSLLPQLPSNYKPCKICNDSGLLSFESEDGLSYAVACNCYKGKKKALALKIDIWQGRESQYINVNGKKIYMTLHCSYLQEKKI